jgi:hypothetical protein
MGRRHGHGTGRLTGLPEYRNGGLLLDAGVIVPRNPRLLARRWKPGDEFIIEWRALTVVLLDELAVLVRERLGLGADALPWPASSKAAPGPPAARSRPNCAPAARRRCRSTATARCSDPPP